MPCAAAWALLAPLFMQSLGSILGPLVFGKFYFCRMNYLQNLTYAFIWGPTEYLYVLRIPLQQVYEDENYLCIQIYFCLSFGWGWGCMGTWHPVGHSSVQLVPSQFPSR